MTTPSQHLQREAESRGLDLQNQFYGTEEVTQVFQASEAFFFSPVVSKEKV